MSEMGIERPTGVMILAVLEIIGGVFAILGGIGMLALGGFAAGYGYGAEGAFFGAIGVIVLLIGLFSLAVGWGLWNLRKWAYQIAMILGIIGIIISILSLPGGFIILVIYAIIIYYLIQPEIKDIFGITGFLS